MAGIYGFLLSLWMICKSLYIDKIHKIKIHSYNETNILDLIRIISEYVTWSHFIQW